MLDLIADAFNMTGNGSLRPVSKADVFGEFTWPLDPEELGSRDAATETRDTRIR